MVEQEAIDEEKLKQKAREISVKEGATYGVMEGFGYRYISPFMISFGASNNVIGLLSSIPSLFGNLAQLFSLRLMEKISRKKIIITSVLLQAILWIPVILAGFFFFVLKLGTAFSSAFLLLSYSVLIFTGSVASPPWSSWMKDLVTEKKGEYFGRRNKIAGIVTLISILVGGLILNYFTKINLFVGYLIIFIIALIGRLFSLYFFIKEYEPKFVYDKKNYFSIFEFCKKMLFNNFGRFVLFVSLITLATMIASPFFAVYMLSDLKFNYFIFTLITLSSAITSFLFMPFWGRFSDKYGSIRVIKITSFLIPLIPLLWLLTRFILIDNFEALVFYLIIVEGFSGFVWGGFNLSSANFVYDAVTREKMAICVAYFNIINSIGGFIGALIGGVLASKNVLLFSLTPILFVFALSAILRFIFALFVFPFIKEIRVVEKLKVKEKMILKTQNIMSYLSFHPIKIARV